MSNRVPAEVFPPGEFIRDELEERGWSQIDLAEIIGRAPRLVNEVIGGKRGITPETALALGKAFGTSAQLWLNLESAYRLSLVEEYDEKTISRKARLYSYPVREMTKRGWIDSSTNLDVLEHQLVRLFRVDSIEERPKLSHAARKTNGESLSNVQLAWLFRVYQLAEAMDSPPYSSKALKDAVGQLRSLLHAPEEVREVPRILAGAGVRYLAVESLPGAKFDGVCFWLDRTPVIAMALRFDRIDNFWFVLRHEIEHVLRRHGEMLDIDLVGDRASPDSTEIPEQEREANKAAAEFCVPTEELDDFIARVGPLYSTKHIINFAERIGVHPGLVVGQLHNRKEIPFSHLRRILVRVRHLITETAFTDGWGSAPQVALPY